MLTQVHNRGSMKNIDQTTPDGVTQFNQQESLF